MPLTIQTWRKKINDQLGNFILKPGIFHIKWRRYLCKQLLLWYFCEEFKDEFSSCEESSLSPLPDIGVKVKESHLGQCYIHQSEIGNIKGCWIKCQTCSFHLFKRSHIQILDNVKEKLSQYNKVLVLHRQLCWAAALPLECSVVIQIFYILVTHYSYWASDMWPV